MPELNDYPWQKQSFTENDILFNPGQPCNRFMLLGQGSVRVELQNTQTRAITLYRIDPGQLCIHSLINLINDENYNYIATAESDGWFCWASKHQFNLWMEQSSSFNHWVLNNIGTRFKQVIDRFVQHSFLPIQQRLANLLIERMQADEIVHNTQADLASELGTAREIISRHLMRWQKQHIIKTQRGEIHILNIDSYFKH